MPHQLVVNKNDAPFDVYIGRPGKWGNPFVIGQDGSRAVVIAKYRSHLIENRAMVASLPELRGKRLGCFCAPDPCHGDVLADFANNNQLTAFCDASIEGGNPGGHGVGGYVVYHDGVLAQPVVLEGAYDFGQHPDLTNNACEYGAVIACLLRLCSAGWNWCRVLVKSDSQLVIRQLTGAYQCADKMLKFRDLVFKAAQHFPKVTYEWIPREANARADALSRSLYERNEIHGTK